MIVVKDLKKNYNGLDVLKGIDLTINKGDVVCLVGPSGCGKSTFLRCLTRLEEPDGGTVMLDGKEITERDIDATRAQMGMVFQHFNLFPHLTVKKNITLAPVRLGRMSQAAADKQAMELLERIGEEDARKELIEHNLRLVVYIARRFENTGVGIEDLISIGTIGLIKAVGTYRTDKNIKLATYASRCIENEILMYLRKNAGRKGEVSFDEPLNTDWDGNELLLSDVLGTEADVVMRPIEELSLIHI